MMALDAHEAREDAAVRDRCLGAAGAAGERGRSRGPREVPRRARARREGRRALAPPHSVRKNVRKRSLALGRAQRVDADALRRARSCSAGKRAARRPERRMAGARALAREVGRVRREQQPRTLGGKVVRHARQQLEFAALDVDLEKSRCAAAAPARASAPSSGRDLRRRRAPSAAASRLVRLSPGSPPKLAILRMPSPDASARLNGVTLRTSLSCRLRSSSA